MWKVLPTRIWAISLITGILGITLLSPVLCSAADSVWKGYQATALEAEGKEQHVLAERAWRSAVAELGSVKASDTRKFISLAHLALAQVECDNANAEATIVSAKLAYEVLIEAVPASKFTNPVKQADGLWKWARSKKDRQQRYSSERAKRLAEALDELTPLNLPAIQLAQLAIESSQTQRDVGHPAVALRQVEQAMAAFRSLKVNNHRLADALSLHAMLLIELARTDDATEVNANLTEWKQIDERLETEKAKDRPARADYLLALVRQSMARSDWAMAMQQMEVFGIGTPNESLPPNPATRGALVTRHQVLSTAVEIHLSLGQTSEASLLIDRLKHDAVVGSLDCGDAMLWDGLMQLALGNLTTSLTRLGEAQTLVTANLGSSHPHLIPVHLLQAMILSETGEFDPGLSRTKDALAISSSPSTGQPSLPAGHPLSIEAITMLARIELRRQHGDEARQFARQAWTMSAVPWPNGGPHATQILAVLTEAEAQIKSPDAVGHLEMLEAADVSALPPLQRGFVDLHCARAAHFLNQPGQARSHYQNALHTWSACQTPSAPHPFSAPAQLGLALLEDIGQASPGDATQKALDAMRSLLGSDGQVAKELSSHGNAFFNAGRYPEAIWLYDRAIITYLRSEGDASTSANSVREYRQRAEDAAKQ